MSKSLEQDCLKNLLIRASYWYYVEGKPIMSDYEYDMEFKRLQVLEEKNGADEDSPTQIVGSSLESDYPEWAKENMDDFDFNIEGH